MTGPQHHPVDDIEYQQPLGTGSRQVRIPADVDRSDTLVAGLTARQTAILAATAVLLWLLHAVTARVVPLPVFAAVAAPVAGLSVAVALGTHDGITADRYLAAMFTHHRSPHLLLPAVPDATFAVDPGYPATPTAGAGQLGRRRRSRVGQLGLPVRAIGPEGALDLGRGGAALVCRASTVAFALRTPAEQDALVAAFGRWLNSLTTGVQLLIRSTPVDLTEVTAQLRDTAPDLPHPDLEAAARRHAEDLTRLTAEHDLLSRDVLIVLRDTTPTTGASGGLSGWWGNRVTRDHRGAVAAPLAATRSGLLRRAAAAADTLTAAGIRLDPLTAAEVTELLTHALDPHGEPRPTAAQLTPVGGIVRAHPGAASAADDADVAWAGQFPDAAVVGELAPGSVKVGARALRVGAGWCQSLVVVGYPREVSPGWLSAVTAHTARLDISVHVQPLSALAASTRLRQQRARFESSRHHDATRGRLTDPELEVAAADARSLAAGIARGQQRLFRVGLTITVHAATRTALDTETARVREVCASLLLDAQPTTYRELSAWHTTLPLGLGSLGQDRTFDTSALAAAFPFAGTGLPDQPRARHTVNGQPDAGPGASGDAAADMPAAVTSGGRRDLRVMYGVTSTGNGLIRWDRFACDNHNAVILARSGAGKSYLAKLELLRALERGVHAAVIDPDNEYTRLAAAVGGTHLSLGAPGVRLNPFDLGSSLDALTRRALFLHTLITVLLGTPMTAPTAAVLDRAILATYAHAGITADPRTHRRSAPDLTDLATVLAHESDPLARGLAEQLHPYVAGSHAGLFTGPSTAPTGGHLIVYSLAQLPEELKAVGTLLTLDNIWANVSNPTQRHPRMVCVDEAWTLMRDPAGAQFLYRMAKAARKHWCGLTVVTQDATDLLSTDLGQAVVANAATQILLRQAPQAVQLLGQRFALSAGERQFLLTARQGEGLLAAGPDRVAFRALAAPWEHHLITTDPTELDS